MVLFEGSISWYDDEGVAYQKALGYLTKREQVVAEKWVRNPKNTSTLEIFCVVTFFGCRV